MIGFVFTAEWYDDGKDAAIHEALVEISERVQTAAKKRDLLSYLSMTFANKAQNVMRSYGVDNVKRMKDTAARYDPEGLFQNLQNGGFLLRNA